MTDSRRISGALRRAWPKGWPTRPAIGAAWVAAAMVFAPPATSQSAHKAAPTASISIKASSFDQLPGWQTDNLSQVWPAFLANCQVMKQRVVAWTNACQQAERLTGNDSAELRVFFETAFKPFEIISSNGPSSGLITGYYEPLVRGSRVADSTYQFPLYKAPKDLVNVDLANVYPELRSLRLRGKLENSRLVPYPTRGEIESKGLLRGQELLWLDDPIDAFFLQVQGSGRVLLPSGETVRVGYAEQNGHPYRSIGKWLIDQGELKAHEASMQGIKAWLARNPGRRDELLQQNPSLVFFKELGHLSPESGPLGSMGVPLSPGRSLAVDPSIISMGTLIFLDTRVPEAVNSTSMVSFQRLVIAQDTGSAIIGLHRGDLFFGTGVEAGELAGKMRSPGTMYVLLPF